MTPFLPFGNLFLSKEGKGRVTHRDAIAETEHVFYLKLDFSWTENQSRVVLLKCALTLLVLQHLNFLKDLDDAVKGLCKLFEHDSTKSIYKTVHYLNKMGHKPKE